MYVHSDLWKYIKKSHKTPQVISCPYVFSLWSVGFPDGSDGKESAYNAGDPSLISWSGRFLWKGMATHSSTLAWRIPWTEESGGLQSMGSQKVRHDWVTNTFAFSLWSVGFFIFLLTFTFFLLIFVCDSFRLQGKLFICDFYFLLKKACIEINFPLGAAFALPLRFRKAFL